MTYKGDFVKNKRTGFGCLYDEKGNLRYKGMWKDNHGEGLGAVYGEGCRKIWEGIFKRGKMTENGKLYLSKGPSQDDHQKEDFDVTPVKRLKLH